MKHAADKLLKVSLLLSAHVMGAAAANASEAPDEALNLAGVSAPEVASLNADAVVTDAQEAEQAARELGAIIVTPTSPVAAVFEGAGAVSSVGVVEAVEPRVPSPEVLPSDLVNAEAAPAERAPTPMVIPSDVVDSGAPAELQIASPLAALAQPQLAEVPVDSVQAPSDGPALENSPVALGHNEALAESGPAMIVSAEEPVLAPEAADDAVAASVEATESAPADDGGQAIADAAAEPIVIDQPAGAGEELAAQEPRAADAVAVNDDFDAGNPEMRAALAKRIYEVLTLEFEGLEAWNKGRQQEITHFLSVGLKNDVRAALEKAIKFSSDNAQKINGLTKLDLKVNVGVHEKKGITKALNWDKFTGTFDLKLAGSWEDADGRHEFGEGTKIESRFQVPMWGHMDPRKCEGAIAELALKLNAELPDYLTKQVAP